ncbi:MAG: hypothetical protein WCP12_11925 [bacterium]
MLEYGNIGTPAYANTPPADKMGKPTIGSGRGTRLAAVALA